MISPFVSWCVAQGVISPLELCGESSSYRSMKYNFDLDSNSIQPNSSSFTLTTPTSITGNILQVPLKSCIIAPTPELLSDKLAYEKSLGDESFYAPYINVLPSSLQNQEEKGNNECSCSSTTSSTTLNSLPRFWNEERIEFVSSYDGYQMERRLKQDERKNVDPWAYACVSSRANYVLGYGYAMTPMLDMINHDSSVPTSAKIVSLNNDSSMSRGDNHDDGDDDNEKEEEALHLFIDETYAIGDEVFISYGDLTNLDTLCNYGFVSETNECNKETVDVLLMGMNAPVQLCVSDKDGSIDNMSLSILRSSFSVPPSSGGGGGDGEDIDLLDEEVYSLIGSFVDGAIYDANEGIEKALEKGDDLVKTYLQCRAKTLQKGLESIKEKFPDILF